MKGDDTPARADIVVTDNRIAAIGPSGNVTVPQGAREFDFAGKYIVPGFVDTHAHWEFRTHDVLEPHNWSLLANLAYGVADRRTSTNDYWPTGPDEIGAAIRARVHGWPRHFPQHFAITKKSRRTCSAMTTTTPNIKSRRWVTAATRVRVVTAEARLMPTIEGGSDMKPDISTLSTASMAMNTHCRSLRCTMTW
jgi:hypothetical protein